MSEFEDVIDASDMRRSEIARKAIAIGIDETVKDLAKSVSALSAGFLVVWTSTGIALDLILIGAVDWPAVVHSASGIVGFALFLWLFFRKMEKVKR